MNGQGYDTIAKEEMTVEESALLCGLLNKYFAVISEDMKGLVETCFFAAWRAGVTKIGSTLEFYDLVSKLGADFARPWEGT